MMNNKQHRKVSAKEALDRLYLALNETSDALHELQYSLDQTGQKQAEHVVDTIILTARSSAVETAAPSE